MNACFTKLSRLSGLALAVLSSAAFAQAPQTVEIPASGQWIAQPGPALNTATFFPQISDAPRARPVRPSNPKAELTLPGPGNSLSYDGSSTGTTSNTLRARFPGVNFSGSIPPDPDIAVGPNHVVLVVNGSVSFYNKAGNMVFSQADSNTGFWNGLGATPFIFDPKVFYDNHANRFVIIELEQQDSPQVSKLLIAVSDDSDPNGTWFRYRIEAAKSYSGNACWFDYPGWGYSTDGYVTTGNMFGFTTSQFGVQALTFQKTPMLTGLATTVTSFDLPSATVQTARTFDSAMTRVFGIGRWNSTNMGIYAFSNLGTATPSVANTTVGVPAWSATSAIDLAPSAGGQSLDTLRDRMMSSFAANGRIWGTHTINTPDNRSQVAWYEVNLNTWPTSGSPSLVQSGTISLASPAWAMMPSIARNNQGDVSVVFSRTSSTIASDMMVATRRSTDAAGVMGAPVLVATSQGTQWPGQNRFGDYSDCEVDPDGFTFWGVTNTFRANNRWGTDITSWVVSTPSGGAGTTNIAPDSASVFFGAYRGGTVGNLAATDSVFYEIDSAMSGSSGQYAGAELRYTTPLAAAATRRLDFNVVPIVSGSANVTGSFFLWNYTLNRWDLVRTFTLATSGSTVITVSSANTASYINASRQVRLLIRSFEATNRQRGRPPTHRLRVDSALMDAIPS